MLTTAGMHPLKPYFLGADTPPKTVTKTFSGSKPKPSVVSFHAYAIASRLK
jgi:hypothetical protein